MNLFFMIYLGMYYILDNTVYLYGNSIDGFGPKQHSLLITFLFHGINVWSLVRFSLATYYFIDTSFFVSAAIIGLSLLAGYLFFYKTRVDKLLLVRYTITMKIISVVVSVVYVTLSAYLMLKVGDYVKYQLSN
jgi:hypothetical protein